MAGVAPATDGARSAAAGLAAAGRLAVAQG
jgi:hypothetical protein